MGRGFFPWHPPWFFVHRDLQVCPGLARLSSPWPPPVMSPRRPPSSRTKTDPLEGFPAIGPTLRAAREYLGLRQVDIAIRMGCSVPLVASFEARSTLTWHNVWRYLTALRMLFGDLPQFFPESRCAFPKKKRPAYSQPAKGTATGSNGSGATRPRSRS